jgi:DUF4097 and DUF4098 domain-containing protein YvlB
MSVKSIVTMLPLALAAAQSAPALAQDRIDESRAVASNERISLDIRRGEVRIQASADGTFRVRGTLDEEAEGYMLESTGGTTRFEVELPRSSGGWGWGGSDDVEFPSDLDIELPAGASLEFQGVSTNVIVTGITGGSEIASVNGRIEAWNLSERVELSTVNGSIVSTGNSGRLEMTTVNGEIADTGSSGRATYSTVNGDLTIASAASEVEVDSVNGDVTLQLQGTQTLALETVNGDLEVTLTGTSSPRIQGSSVSGDLTFVLDGGIDARVSLETHSGDIDNGLSDALPEGERAGPRKSLQFTVGQGGGEIELRSISGSLTLALP